jgi:uracil-DNA glycosylase
MTSTHRPVTELVDPGWVPALEPLTDHIAHMGEFLRAEAAAGRGFLPAGDRVLRAFTIPFDSIRVLIVGQDPYPTPGHPVGLAFSVEPDMRPIPKSLQNIYRELHDDLGVTPPANGDLTPWTRHGVLLLNRVLSVQPHRPASHRGKGWEQVTEAAIRALAARDAPLVAILWGRDAQSVRPFLGDTPVVMSPHPSPLSASHGFFGSKPFSRANALLERLGAQPIDWRLAADA